MEIDDLLAGNSEFRATKAFAGLEMMPRRRMMVVACADPRVDPEKVLGLGLGDSAVIRNIGGRVTTPTLATISGLATLGAQLPGPPGGQDRSAGMDLIVLQHTGCGILRLADQPAALAHFLGATVEDVAAMHVRDPQAAVVHDTSILRAAVPAAMRVWGLVYDVTSGQVDVAVRPQEVRS